MNTFWSSADAWGENALARLWTASWQGCVAVAAAWLAVRCWKGLSPRVECWLWRWVSVKFLVALLGIAPIALPLLPAVRAAIAPRPGGAALPQAELSMNPDGRVVGGKISTSTDNRTLPGTTFPWIAGVVGLWMSGVAMRAGMVGRQWLRVRRLYASATSIAGEEANALLHDEAARLNVRRLPRLAAAASIDAPLLTGIWRPAILLPQAFEANFDRGEVRLMLAHELAHQRRRDLAWNWLLTIVSTLFFFHPLVWLLARRWSEAQEAACDELVLQNRGAQPSEYGRLLLRLAISGGQSSLTPIAAVGVLGGYRQLERRLLALPRMRPMAGKRLVVAILVATLFGALGVIPWRVVAQDPAAKAPTDAEMIQGKWLLRRLDQVDIQPTDEERQAWKDGKIVLEITADKIIFHDGSAGEYKLDLTRQPKQLTLKTSQGTAKGIYELKADQLRFCIGRAGEGAPAGFDVQEIHQESPTQFPTCFSLERAPKVARNSGPRQGVWTSLTLNGEILSGDQPRLAAEAYSERHQQAAAELERLGANVSRSNKPGVAVAIFDAWKGSDTDLELIAKLDRVSFLLLDCQKISDRSLGFLRKFESDLQIQLLHVNDVQLESLRESTSLANLHLFGNNFSDAGVAAVATLSKLQTLHLHGRQTNDATVPVSRVSDAGLAQLKNCKELRELQISELPGVTGTTLDQLANLPHLDQLWTLATPISDEGLAAICKLVQLRRLYIWGDQISSAGYASIANLTRMQQLGIGDAKHFDDAAAESLAKLTRLRSLGVYDTRMTDVGLSHLSGLAELQLLDLWKGKFSDKGFMQLKQLTKLRRLNVDGDLAVTDAGFTAVESMPQLEQLMLPAKALTDAGLKSLHGCRQLKLLRLDGARITGEGFVELQTLGKLLKASFNECPIRDSAIAALKPLSELSELSLENTPISDGAIPFLKELSGLRKLQLNHTAVTDAQIAELGSLKRLTELDVAGAKVTEEGAKALQEKRPGVSVNGDWNQDVKWTIGSFSLIDNLELVDEPPPR